MVVGVGNDLSDLSVPFTTGTHEETTRSFWKIRFTWKSLEGRGWLPKERRIEEFSQIISNHLSLAVPTPVQ